MLSLKPQTKPNHLIESHSFSFAANFQIMAVFHPFEHFLFILFVFIPTLLANNTTNLNYHNTNNNISSINVAGHNTTSSIPNASPFKPSSAIFVFIAILTILFCIIFLLLLYSKRCATDNNNNNNIYAHSSSLLSVSAGRNSGINRVVVESLPLFRFSSLSGSKDGLECAVCLTRFEPNELLRLLPKCKHAFHAECVDTWLEAHSTCPLCRYRVDPEDILLIQDQDLSLSFGSGTESVPSRTRRVSGRHTYAGGERARTSGGGKTTTLGSYRKDGLLLLERKRLEHRIIVSGSGRGDGCGTELGSGFHQRWSDVQPSDMLYLRSEMIISQSRRLGVRSLVAEAGAGNNYKNNVEKDDGNGKEKKGAERRALVEEQ